MMSSPLRNAEPGHWIEPELRLWLLDAHWRWSISWRSPWRWRIVAFACVWSSSIQDWRSFHLENGTLCWRSNFPAKIASFQCSEGGEIVWNSSKGQCVKLTFGEVICHGLFKRPCRCHAIHTGYLFANHPCLQLHFRNMDQYTMDYVQIRWNLVWQGLFSSLDLFSVGLQVPKGGAHQSNRIIASTSSRTKWNRTAIRQLWFQSDCLFKNIHCSGWVICISIWKASD